MHDRALFRPIPLREVATWTCIYTSIYICVCVCVCVDPDHNRALTGSTSHAQDTANIFAFSPLDKYLRTL